MNERSAISRVHFVKSKSLKCLLDEAKHGFFGATNAVFGKIGRVASEEIVLELVKCKCCQSCYMVQTAVR